MGRRPSQHHAFTDREGDPHSPRREARNLETIRKFAPDIIEDRLERAIFSWGWLGLGLGIALLCLVLGLWPGLIAALAHAILYVFVIAPAINGIGHWRGAQNFQDTAYNSSALAWMTGGESLHNNHHAHPRAPKFSIGRSEFDPSWLVVRVLAAIRLVVIIDAPVSPSAGGAAAR